MIFHISVQPDHIRTIKDPVNEHVRIVHALLNVNDLPDLPLEPDPRRPKPNGKVTKRIQKSVASNSGRFHLLNRGITICVEKYDFDNKTNILRLSIPDESENYGIIDGGHTHFAIHEALKVEKKRLDKTLSDQSESGPVFENQFVHVEILERVEDYLAEIAEARNFSIQLKNWTLAHYRKEFDWLLDVLGRSDADQIIKLSENDEKPVGIIDVIQVLGAANPSLFPDERPAKDAYTAQGKILGHFIDPDDPAEFRAMTDVASDILELYDYVRLHFHREYNKPDETGKTGRYGATREAKIMAKKHGAEKDAEFWWLGRKNPAVGGNIIPVKVKGVVPVDKGMAIPLISGFRALLEKVEGRYQWLTDPFEFFDKYGDKLVAPIMTASDNEKREPWFVGRNPTIYTQLTDTVRRWYLEDYKASSVSKGAS